jgi:hypothetical protein
MSVKRSSVALLVLAVAVTVLAAVPGAQAGQTDLSTRSFQTPSGNIHCLLQRSNNVLRCDILSGLDPEPNKPCRFDWVGLLLPREGRAQPNCASDTIANQDAPVLQYGERWERRGRYCISRRSGLSCHSFGGWHFKLSRDDWGRWYTE